MSNLREFSRSQRDNMENIIGSGGKRFMDIKNVNAEPLSTLKKEKKNEALPLMEHKVLAAVEKPDQKTHQTRDYKDDTLFESLCNYSDMQSSYQFSDEGDPFEDSDFEFNSSFEEIKQCLDNEDFDIDSSLIEYLLSDQETGSSFDDLQETRLEDISEIEEILDENKEVQVPVKNINSETSNCQEDMSDIEAKPIRVADSIIDLTIDPNPSPIEGGNGIVLESINSEATPINTSIENKENQTPDVPKKKRGRKSKLELELMKKSENAGVSNGRGFFPRIKREMLGEQLGIIPYLTRSQNHLFGKIMTRSAASCTGTLKKISKIEKSTTKRTIPPNVNPDKKSQIMDEKNRKRSTWNWNSEQLLLRVWAKRKEDLRRAKQNSFIVKEMARELNKQNYSFTFTTVKDKMHNMTKRYRKERAAIEKGGLPSKWTLYHQMDQLLGKEELIKSIKRNQHNNNNVIPSTDKKRESNDHHRPLDPIFLEMPSTSSPLLIPLKESPKSDSSISPPTPTFDASHQFMNSDATFHGEVLKRFDNINEEIRQTNEEFSKINTQILLIEQQKMTILRKYVENSVETNKAFVEYLHSKTKKE